MNASTQEGFPEAPAATRAEPSRHNARVSSIALFLAGSTSMQGVMIIFFGLLAFILGFALNFGSICTVIATTEMISEKRPARLVGLFEAAAWAALAYAALATAPTVSQGWASIGYLVPAALLFGVGSYINGACVFGSVGHFGNGQLDFGFTFLGVVAVFYFASAFDLVPDRPPAATHVPLAVLPLAVVLLSIMTVRFAFSRNAKDNFRRLWLSMAAVAICFTLLAITTPGFSITTSVGNIVSIPISGAVIAIGLFGGSFLAARVSGRAIRFNWPTLYDLATRALGGVLMGLGALLIPGGNDTLLLIGLPMGAWEAALAYSLFIASLAVLVFHFGSNAKAWS